MTTRGDESRTPAPAEFQPGQIVRIDAGAVVDAYGTAAAPGALLVRRLSNAPGRELGPVVVLASGTPSEVSAHPAWTAAGGRALDRSDCVLFPGLINAHTHLDLTHIGPQPHDPRAGFVPWVDMIRSRRHVDDAGIAASVRRGVELSLAAGTVAVGDIAGAPAGRMSLVPWRTLQECRMPGVSYAEFFGIGASRLPREQGLRAFVDAAMDEACEAASTMLNGVPAARLGLQPHAPNTVDVRLYAAAVQLAQRLPGRHICTHLAESPEERRFVAAGEGPQRELLERFGLWTDEILEHVGKGLHPVEHLAPVLMDLQFGAVHVNDATDETLGILARSGATVVYCPRASAYFHAHDHFGPHRYRDMLGAGIPVALGTDSLVNQPEQAASTPDEGGTGISVLEEMRFLSARDDVDPEALLVMGTRTGAALLGVEHVHQGLRPGDRCLGIVSVKVGSLGPSRQARPIVKSILESDRPAVLL